MYLRKISCQRRSTVWREPDAVLVQQTFASHAGGLTVAAGHTGLGGVRAAAEVGGRTAGSGYIHLVALVKVGGVQNAGGARHTLVAVQGAVAPQTDVAVRIGLEASGVGES